MSVELLKFVSNLHGKVTTPQFNQSLLEMEELKDKEILKALSQRMKSYILVVYTRPEDDTFDNAFNLLKGALDLPDFDLDEIWLIEDEQLKKASFIEFQSDQINDIFTRKAILSNPPSMEEAYRKLSKLVRVRKVRKNEINEVALEKVKAIIAEIIVYLGFRAL